MVRYNFHYVKITHHDRAFRVGPNNSHIIAALRYATSLLLRINLVRRATARGEEQHQLRLEPTRRERLQGAALAGLSPERCPHTALVVCSATAT